MADNNLKVTLSADDIATEVVRKLASAVKQLENQQRTANQATTGASRAAKDAAGSFSGFQKAIAGVAAAFGALRVAQFVRDTIEATDSIGKLAQKTGATTEALSVLSVAASTADLSQEELSSGLKFLSRSFSELNAGVPQTVEAFGALGLSAKDLRGLSLDQVLVKVADAQEKFGDGAGKAAALMKIFGRNGTELIPLLHDLANGGFDQAATKAKDLGLVISGDAANAARDFNDSIATLQNAFKGLVVQLTPAIKGVADLASGLAEFVAHHADLIGFTTALVGTALAISQITKAIVALRAATAAGGILALLNPGTVLIASFALLATTIGFVVAKLIEAHNAKKALEQPLATDPTLDKALGIGQGQKPQVNLADAAQRKAEIDAQLAALKQGLKDETAATQSGLALAAEIEAEHFAQGLTSLREYYAQRVQITRQGVNAQIAELEAEKQAITSAPLAENTDAERTKRASEIKALESQIARLKIDGQVQVLQLLQQEFEARLRIAEQVRGFQADILKAQGQQAAADQLAIAQRVNNFILALEAQGGHTRAEIQAQADQLKNLLSLQSQFSVAQNRANQETASLDLARQAIQSKVALGLISERDGQLQIAAVERDRLPTLENLADQMDRFAAEAGNPELVQAAEEFRASFQNMGVVVDQSTIKLANLRETLLGAVQSDLSQFLGDTISHVNSLADAFRQLAATIVGSFQRVLGDIIATAAVDKIRGLFEGGSGAAPAVATASAAKALDSAGITVGAGAAATKVSAGALSESGGILIIAARALQAAAAALATAGASSNLSSFLLSGGALAGFASGGAVSGPGTGTSDSILARLSHGEYVLRADAVRRLGVPYLDMLNGFKMPSLTRPQVGGVPAFATGGFVSGGSSSATLDGGFEATLGLEDGLVLRHVKSRGGVKVLRDVIAGNPNMFKAALGIV